MRVHSTNESFRAIAHPYIHNVWSNRLLANRCKRMSQKVLRYFFIVHNAFEDSIQYVCSMRHCNLGQIKHCTKILMYRNFLILNLSAFAFAVACDKEIAFSARRFVFDFTGLQAKEIKYVCALFNLEIMI